ncbi:MAG: hypothetical protein ACFB20_13235 [Opitutales bacterium]
MRVDRWGIVWCWLAGAVLCGAAENGPGARLLYLVTEYGTPRFALVNHTQEALTIPAFAASDKRPLHPQLRYQVLASTGRWQHPSRALTLRLAASGEPTQHVLEPNDRLVWEGDWLEPGVYRAGLSVDGLNGSARLQTAPFAVRRDWGHGLDEAVFVEGEASFFYLDAVRGYAGLAWRDGVAVPFVVLKAYPDAVKQPRVRLRALDPDEYAARLQDVEDGVQSGFRLQGLTPLWLTYETASGRVTGHAIVGADWVGKTGGYDSPGNLLENFLHRRSRMKLSPRPAFDYRCALAEELPLDVLPEGK